MCVCNVRVHTVYIMFTSYLWLTENNNLFINSFIHSCIYSQSY